MNYKGRGVGDIIMQKIFSVLYQLNQSIGFRILVVDAKEHAINFYCKYSFKEAYKNGNEATMYLDTKELLMEIDRMKGLDK
jgi:predicted GNAT family N-acyltransferase